MTPMHTCEEKKQHAKSVGSLQAPRAAGLPILTPDAALICLKRKPQWAWLKACLLQIPCQKALFQEFQIAPGIHLDVF